MSAPSVTKKKLWLPGKRTYATGPCPVRSDSIMPGGSWMYRAKFAHAGPDGPGNRPVPRRRGTVAALTAAV